jgi:parallel beta helix pectate lyase-like protein
MRKLITAGIALGLGIALSVPAAAVAAAAAGSTIVVSPGQSIQAAVNQAEPGDTVLVKPGVYHQAVQIRTDGITLRGSGDFPGGTVIKPPPTPPRNLCSSPNAFGPTGVCILAKKLNTKTGAVITPVYNDTVTGLYVTGFSSNGVFGYGTYGLTVQRVVATDDGEYGISRFVSTKTLFADDTAIGNEEAGFYVGDSPDAATVVRDNVAKENALGIFVRHARGVTVTDNRATGNCQGVLVLDDGERGGAGNAVVQSNSVFRNNMFCPANEEAPPLQGGGILLVGATQTKVLSNSVKGNVGSQFNSGGIVVVSAAPFHGSDPAFDTIARNTAFRDKPADLRWDGSGNNIRFVGNHCTISMPAGVCQ